MRQHFEDWLDEQTYMDTKFGIRGKTTDEGRFLTRIPSLCQAVKASLILGTGKFEWHFQKHLHVAEIPMWRSNIFITLIYLIKF